MSAISKVFLLMLMLGATSCTHSVHQYAISDYTDTILRGTVIKVTVKEKDWFYSSNTEYFDRAYKKLLEKCPDGEIHGVHLRYSTSHSFLSYTNTIFARAYCVK